MHADCITRQEASATLSIIPCDLPILPWPHPSHRPLQVKSCIDYIFHSPSLATAARRALHALATTGDAAALDAVVAHCAAGSKLCGNQTLGARLCSMAWSFRVIDVTLSPCPRVGVEVHEGARNILG